MALTTDWQSLAHQKRVEILANNSDQQIIDKYRLPGDSPEERIRFLAQERALWVPKEIGDFRKAGKPPTKDSLLGAYRDLQRSEALLELIDNSIDVWLTRRSGTATVVEKELNIFIDIDKELGLLTYEDNAGGVLENKLIQLVVPGYSDTDDFSHTIGSYKTGGKKAVFRLATAAQIMTWHRGAEGRTEQPFSVQLDQNWLSDPDLYQFEYAPITDKKLIEQGHTKYVLRLHEEPEGGTQWYQQLGLNEQVERQINDTYGLLLVRNPDIHIHYRDRARALTVDPQALYDFSGAKDGDINITPQQVIFRTKLPYKGKNHDIDIEVIIGCRRGVGAGPYGLDLYGNDRLFVACDQDLFQSVLPRGNAARLFRGLINIQGPNVFVPWDTHKRHLNIDREITRLILMHPLITKVFDNWFSIYKKIGGGGRGEVKSRINVPLKPSPKRQDLPIPNRAKLDINAHEKRGVLPENLFTPHVKVITKASDRVDIKLHFTRAEGEQIKRYYVVSGDVADQSTRTELATRIQEDVLKRASRARAK